MDRIEKLCGYLDGCESFADVGCDHGYCTLYMLEKNLCKRAYVSDISEKCLEKAEKLLEKHIACGRVVPFCCNGLEKVPAAEQVLIAGMGGEEIVSILRQRPLPEKFLLQPMKNARLVREFLISAGAGISYDGVFQSGGKFYTVIKGGRAGVRPAYSEAQLEYGLDLYSDAARDFLYAEYEKKLSYLKRPLSDGARLNVLAQAELIGGILRDR